MVITFNNSSNVSSVAFYCSGKYVEMEFEQTSIIWLWYMSRSVQLCFCLRAVKSNLNFPRKVSRCEPFFCHCLANPSHSLRISMIYWTSSTSPFRFSFSRLAPVFLIIFQLHISIRPLGNFNPSLKSYMLSDCFLLHSFPFFFSPLSPQLCVGTKFINVAFSPYHPDVVICNCRIMLESISDYL